MPSRADIPEYLQTPDRRGEFTEWLIHHPIDFPTARALAHIWTKITKVQLLRSDWLMIEHAFKRPTNA